MSPPSAPRSLDRRGRATAGRAGPRPSRRWTGALGAILALALLAATAPTPALAGWADTLPAEAIIVETSYLYSPARYRYDERFRAVPFEEVDMYDPGGDYQGTVILEATVVNEILLWKVAAGITDRLTAGVVVPLVVNRATKLDLGWTPGEYMPSLGRAYSEQDFWEYAESMGQPRPGDYHDGTAEVGDILLVALYNFYRSERFAITGFFGVSTMTGSPEDPEIVGAQGTSGFFLGSYGDLDFHLFGEVDFPDWPVLERLTVNAELLYEHFWTRELPAARGTANPLIFNDDEVTGPTYEVTPAPFLGYGLGLDITLVRAPEAPNWITRESPELQARMPPTLSLQLGFQNIFFGDREVDSRSEIWDDLKESEKKAGVKFNLVGKLVLSLLGHGVPADLYFRHFNQEAIAGKNYIPNNTYEAGLRLYLSLAALRGT